MSSFAFGNLFLVMSILAASVGQILIKKILDDLPTEITAMESLSIIFSSHRIWRASFAVVLIVSGFIFWILCLHKLPLSYAYPLACSSALVVALLSTIFLGESVTLKLLLGTFLIALGSALVVGQK